MRDQAHEGCNIAGRVRVNKVVGNVYLSPGRSFRTSSQNIYELVPYLKEDGNRHDFTHTIHEFAFEGDDEYDYYKAEMSSKMRKKLGIIANPLDETTARVRTISYTLFPVYTRLSRLTSGLLTRSGLL